MNAVLLQEPSVFCLIAGARAIRRAGTVYIGRRVPLADVPPARVARARRWITRLNSSARVVELPLEAVTAHLWRLNEEAVDTATRLAEEIRASRVYATVHRVIRNDALVKYFQAALVRRLPNEPLLQAIAADLARGGNDVTVVAAWDSVRPEAERARHRFARAAAAWRWALASAAVPAADAVRRLRHGLARRAGRRYEVALPVVWGLRHAAGAPSDARRPQDDSYLYGPSFAAGGIVHVFTDWKLDPATAAETRSALAARDLPHVVRDQAGLNVHMLPQVGRASGAGLRLLLPGPRSRLDALLLTEVPKAFYTYLKKHAECLAAPAAVAVVKDDYNPGHVIGTIACHERGMKTFGIQHVASSCDAPQLAFVHLDRHAVYAPMLTRAFESSWPPEMLEPVGRESIDWVAESAGDPARRSIVRKRWRTAYPSARGPVVLVLFPGAREICLDRQWDQMYEGLSAFAGTSADATIVLRFRTIASLRHPSISRFARLPERDARFVVEMSNFTTYELLAVSDFVIAPEASFTINEAAAAGVPVVTFEYVGTASRYFGTYGRDFVLRSSGDVLRVLRQVTAGLPLDCDWKALSRDANYFNDGRNRERLQQAVRRLVDGTPDATMAAARLSVSA